VNSRSARIQFRARISSRFSQWRNFERELVLAERESILAWNFERELALARNLERELDSRSTTGPLKFTMTFRGRLEARIRIRLRESNSRLREFVFQCGTTHSPVQWFRNTLSTKWQYPSWPTSAAHLCFQ
jgi:hypothetical protein